MLTNLLFGFVVSRYALALPLEASLVIAAAFSATSVGVNCAGILYQCREIAAKIISDGVYAAMVVVSLVTSIVSPLFLRRLLRREA